MLTQDYPRQRFSTRTILVPLAFMVLHMLVISLAAGLVTGVSYIIQDGQTLADLDLSAVQTYSSLVGGLVLIPIYSIFLYFNKKSNKIILAAKRPRIWDLSFAVISSLSALFLSHVLIFFVSVFSTEIPWLYDKLQAYEDLAESLAGTTTGLLLTSVSLAIVVPIAEELLFRGIVMGELLKVMPGWLAVTCQAILFSLFHLNFIQSLYVLIPGIILGLSYYLTKSIYVPILVHMVYNFFGGVLFTVIEEEDDLGRLMTLETISVFLFVGFLVFVYGLKKEAGLEER